MYKFNQRSSDLTK